MLVDRPPDGIELLWATEQFPFTIGAFSEPHNPASLPDMLPFALGLDTKRGLLVQIANDTIRAALTKTYQKGSLLGTPMDDTPSGRGYADDFLGYIRHMTTLGGTKVLEVGCGRGYLLRRMTAFGAAAQGIDPGEENLPHWKKYGVHAVSALFPTPSVPDKFQLIVCYGVLEHIENYTQFLTDIRSQLQPGGQLILAVPNVSVCIDAGDPSMLAHEHFIYCTDMTLPRVLASGGFAVRDIQEARHGGALYCCAAPADMASALSNASELELTEARRFAERCNVFAHSVAAELRNAERRGRTVGIFCPGRGLAVLPTNTDCRFFDDDPALTGNYYPPFATTIESRAALLERPVDELLILSRSFGQKIKKSLMNEPRLAHCRIKTVDEMLAERAVSNAAQSVELR